MSGVRVILCYAPGPFIITGGGNVDEDNIDEWINCDANDPDFEHFTDEKIIGGVSKIWLRKVKKEKTIRL